jgi:hypothetical protein
VSIWSARLARGAELWFSPTIGAAIEAQQPWLTFYCPGCGVTGTGVVVHRP